MITMASLAMLAEQNSCAAVCADVIVTTDPALAGNTLIAINARNARFIGAFLRNRFPFRLNCSSA
jgi:hypothetical protein